jgi:hypothetical protein
VTMLTGEELLLSHGPVLEAVLADAATPAALPPVAREGRELMAIEPIDFGHADELIVRSRSDGRRFLDRGGAERPPLRMRMHRHEPRREVRKRARPSLIEHEDDEATAGSLK